MCVPASVAMTVSYISKATMERVLGSSTGGIVLRAAFFWDQRVELEREVASADEVSRTRPAIGGRARVRALREFGIGRL